MDAQSGASGAHIRRADPEPSAGGGAAAQANVNSWV